MPKLMSNVQRLQHFLCVVESGTLTRAAEILGISQPALTKSIHRLEYCINGRLLERTPHGMVPTELGEALARRARIIQAEVQYAEDELATLSAPMMGYIRVGTGPSVIDDILPRAIGRFSQENPAVRFVVREGLVVELLDALAEGLIDLAVVSNSRSIDPELFSSIPVMRDDLCVVTGADHELANAGRCDLVKLLDYHWVLPERREPIRHRLEEVFRANGLGAPSPVIETNSAACMKSLARQEGFVTWLPRMLVAQDCQLGRLAVVDINDATFERQVYLCRRHSSSDLPMHQQFVSVLQSTFHQAALAIASKESKNLAEVIGV